MSDIVRGSCNEKMIAKPKARGGEGRKKSRCDSDLQSLCFCQFCLAVVEGPEAVGFKFQRAGNVQTV